MKKQLLVFLLAGIFTLHSCSSDDDSNNKEQDPVLGTWILVEIDPPAFDVDACEEPSIISFHSSKVANTTIYRENNNCDPEHTSGDWENLGYNRYKITIPILGPTQGTVEFEGSNRFTFFGPNAERLVFQRQ